MSQHETPLFDAMQRHIDADVAPFHVPGHKHGVGLPELREYLGDRVFQMDVNAMSDVDDLGNPTSVIAAAQQLTAEAFGARSSHFLINGTTMGIHAMMLAALRPGEQIVLPRNCHKSAFTGLIMSGGVPVFAPVGLDATLGISTTMSEESLKEIITKFPYAVAVFVINPSYWGFCTDLKRIVEICHEWDAAVLVDEAHGGHLGFHEGFPTSAMEAGADLASASMHKTGGSFTQSSVLLYNSDIIPEDLVFESISLLRSTSASYLLMTSLDVARKQLALRGRQMLEDTRALAREARARINRIDGLHAFGDEIKERCPEIHAIDETKLCVNVRGLGLTGYETEQLLRYDHGVQIEMADLNNIMAIITIGDRQPQIDRLVTALETLAASRTVVSHEDAASPPEMPELIVIPRDAFYGEKKFVSLEQAAGEICGEMVMSYPPGIPVVIPGERITQDIVDYIKLLKSHNCMFQGTADPTVERVRVLGFPSVRPTRAIRRS